MIRVDLNDSLSTKTPMTSIRLPAVPHVGDDIEFGGTRWTVTRVLWAIDKDALIEDPDGIPIPTYYAIATVK